MFPFWSCIFLGRMLIFSLNTHHVSFPLFILFFKLKPFFFFFPNCCQFFFPRKSHLKLSISTNVSHLNKITLLFYFHWMLRILILPTLLLLFFNSNRVPISLYPLQGLLLSAFLTTVILVGGKCFLIVVWTYISLRLQMLSVLSCAYWSFVFLLCRNSYLNHLPLQKNCYFCFYCLVVRIFIMI